jgi:hypothetical protein
MIKKIVVSSLLLLITLFQSSAVFAVDEVHFGDIESKVPGTKFSGSAFSDIIQGAMPFIFGFAGFGLLIYLIYGGIHLMISAGDPKAMQEARGKISNALVGFVIIFIAFWIVQIVGRVFGLQPIVKIFG